MVKIESLNLLKYCFVIAHRHVVGYESYLQFYIYHIEKYHSGSCIIVVDNNSASPLGNEDYIRDNKRVVFLTNLSNCKFEIGAYLTGIDFLVSRAMLPLFDVIFFTQDNFVLKNKINHKRLCRDQFVAATICTFDFWDIDDVTKKMFHDLKLSFDRSKVHFGCWCSSFLIRANLVEVLRSRLGRLTLTTRAQSQAGERALGQLLSQLSIELANKPLDALDGRTTDLPYNPFSIDLILDSVPTTFGKRLQQKTEVTVG